MKKFIVLAHATESALKKISSMSPDESKKGMDAWMAWSKQIGENLVDLGTPLGNARMVTKGGSQPSKTTVVGYMILQADDMDAAINLLKNHQHLQWDAGCTFEIHESLPMPGVDM